MSRLTGNERAIVVTALKHAAPYIRMFKRKVFVIKAVARRSNPLQRHAQSSNRSGSSTKSASASYSSTAAGRSRLSSQRNGGFRFSSLTVVVSPMRARSKYPLPF